MKKIVALILIAVVCAFPLAKDAFEDRTQRPMVKVPPRHAAYKTVFGVIQDTTYGPGLVWQVPFTGWLGNKIDTLNIEPRYYPYNLHVKTEDLQELDIQLSVLCTPCETNVHKLITKYPGYDVYEQKVIKDLMQSIVTTMCGFTNAWSLVGGYEKMTTDAINYIINDQLVSEGFVTISAVRLLGYKASPEFEKLMEETAQLKQKLTIEQLKAQVAEIETKRVKEEATQTYEKLAAVAQANGLEIKIKADALKDNPFVAQYEIAKALQKWNGNIPDLPQTLTIMKTANADGVPALFFGQMPTGK